MDFFRSNVPVNLIGIVENLAKKYISSKRLEEKKSIDEEALSFIEKSSKSLNDRLALTGYYGLLRRLY